MMRRILIILAFALTAIAIAGGIFHQRRADRTGQQPPAGTSEKKILYYRNPMDPQITSPVPMKDSMGMDYVPVYSEEQASQGTSGVYISPEKQQVIGMKKETVKIRDLALKIRVVGKVAYDPGLFTAQEEYLLALKSERATSWENLPEMKEQMRSMSAASAKKLLLLGMTEKEIAELAKQGVPQSNLYLPGNSGTVWVYLTINEYQVGLIKTGIPLEIEAVAFPGERFQGRIVAIPPVLDSATRSLQVRAIVGNPGQKLKPEMFVNATIRAAVGRKLSVSEEAVLNTGTRTVVIVAGKKNNFLVREIQTGQKADGYYEVKEGLREGDTVVTSGNFLIDSEARLKSSLNKEAEK